jgi:hypothetical protein
VSKNTAPTLFDVTDTEQQELTQEEILMSENDILQGLLELGETKDQENSYRKIQIKRDKKLKLEFRVRPISEDESQSCLHSATSYVPKTKKWEAKKAIETDYSLYRSFLIYTATVDEDRAKVWDNKKAQEALGVLRGVEMIDKVLLVGEKDRVLDIIDEISGFEEEAEKKAKN